MDHAAWDIAIRRQWWVEPGAPGSLGEGCWFVMHRPKHWSGGVQVYNHAAPWPTDPRQALIEADQWMRGQEKT